MLSGSSHRRTDGTGIYLDLPTWFLMIVDWKVNSQLEEHLWWWDDCPMFGSVNPWGVFPQVCSVWFDLVQAAQRCSLATVYRDEIGQLNGDLANNVSAKKFNFHPFTVQY